MKYCPWCGQLLEIKTLDLGQKFRHVCSRCGWKIREIAKPEPEPEPKEEEQSKVVEIRGKEVPAVAPKPAWPVILGAAILIVIIITLVKIFLV